MQRAGEWLGQCGKREVQSGWYRMCVADHKSFWHQQIFRKCPIDVVEILAKILTLHPAVEALSTGCGVGHRDRVADTKLGYAFTNFGDSACHLMTKQGWHFEHARMTTSFEDLYIGAARGGRTNGKQ